MDYLGSTREAIGQEKLASSDQINRPFVLKRKFQSRFSPKCRQPVRYCAVLIRILATPEIIYAGDMKGYSGIATTCRYRLSEKLSAEKCQCGSGSTGSPGRSIASSANAIRRGLTEVTLSGRFQIISARPAIILDVAHNPAAAHKLSANLDATR